LVHIELPNDLVSQIRPFFETPWEAKVREEQKRIISASEVLVRALSEIWAIKKGKTPMPKFYNKAEDHEGPAARKFPERKL